MLVNLLNLLDFIFEESNSIFPTKNEFQHFMKNYISHFGIDSVKLKCEVRNIISSGDKYIVRY